jgi:cytochrome P450
MRTQELDAAIANPATYADEAGYHALFTHLRANAPVHWTEPEGYDPFWTISKYNDIQEIERQSDVFLNAPRTALRTKAQEDAIRKMTGSRQVAHTIIQMDGAEHRAHRLLTQAWFAPAKLKSLEDRVAQLARHHVHEMEKKGGSCDFVRDVAVWFPLQAVTMVLGAPIEDTPFILKMTQQHFGSDDPDLKRQGATSSTGAVKDLFDYFNKMTEERRKNPKDDIFSILADAKIDGKPISDHDRNSYYFILAIAGHDTTSSSISGALLALLQHPEQFAKLRANHALLSTAVDEGIRWVSPVKHFFRTAAKDTVVRGQNIREGDSLLLSYPSGNRDEEVYNDPFEFRIDRSPNRHLAFGYGVHLCLGQHFAKMEMRLLFSELLNRIQDISLAGKPEWMHANFVGGLKSLPISYRADRAAA